jgi:hypothetical protein
MIPRISSESSDRILYDWSDLASIGDHITYTDMEIARYLEEYTGIIMFDRACISCRSIGDIGDL